MTIQILHCSYHKCLTVYYYRVMAWMFNRLLPLSRGYRHFNSRLDEFYEKGQDYRVSSLNNQAVDLTKLGDSRITRFVRDPRDLIVSGYFYHRRGAENWCNVVGATDDDWIPVNGRIPEGMTSQHSFSSYLQSLSLEDGLIAEMQFRTKHLQSMTQWPEEDRRIRLFRYEDILGNEQQVFAEMFKFYGMSWAEQKLGLFLVNRFSAKKQAGAITHIRNPSPGQWREHFTPRVTSYFENRFGDILQHCGYDDDRHRG